MRIIQPEFKLYAYGQPLTSEIGVQLLRWCEWNGRISHRTEESHYTADSWQKFIPAVVLSHGDWSICEHSHVTAVVRIDRGISHEWVRHRIGAYTQESTRFVNYKKVGEIDVIKPADLRPEEDSPWTEGVAKACLTYTQMMERGSSPQRARSVLPNALATTLSATYNLRSWRWFMLARTSKESHPDMRRITIPILLEMKKNIPLIFDDIEPENRQVDNFRKAH